MKEKSCYMNSQVLERFMEIIHHESLPIHLTRGSRRKEVDGSTSIEVVYQYEMKDDEVVNEALCRAINLTFDLHD